MNLTDNSIVLNLGIDIGSTSIKFAATDNSDNIIFYDYRRHNANIRNIFIDVCQKMLKKIGNKNFKIAITGSIGMGYAQRLKISFIQEVIASAKWVKEKHKEIRTFIDIGGEDSKVIFFHNDKVPDIRMNGNCAGGTGAFIDQTAVLLNVETSELNDLAKKHTSIYPIASRCGVFSKTDIQNLISRNVSKEDISASVLNSVATQVVVTLARGSEIQAPVLFCGGPFTFIPELKNSFINILKLKDSEFKIPENAQIFPALGSATIAKESKDDQISLSSLIERLNDDSLFINSNKDTLPSLFTSTEEFNNWRIKKENNKVNRLTKLERNSIVNCHLGIDSGSTTTKIVLLDEQKNLIFQDYNNNKGDSFNTFLEGIKKIQTIGQSENITFNILSSTATGYGENLLKKAFGLDFGVVETIAHYIAAKNVSPDVSFILDIGGQDMKAIFIENGNIQRIEINEACSSGCGSFIETFANLLNYSVKDFATLANTSKNPCDLGTRCTVFMNSKIKQSLREGTSISDISAGFSYSVVKNCLYKVLKLQKLDELGNNIVVQGGTFKNLSIVRALELLSKKNVYYTDIPELMGAYGAALYGLENKTDNKYIKLDELVRHKSYKSSSVCCKGCENFCSVKAFEFENGNSFYAGNNCEKIYSNRSEKKLSKGKDLYSEKYKLLFNNRIENKNDFGISIGIPRALGIYENYPFWQALFASCGIKTVLSNTSTNNLFDLGVRTIMSDNICFPAKLMHGHILDLVNKKVDRIIYPYVIYERSEDKTADNCFNCPIVTGYSDVIKSAIDTKDKYNIPLDSPIISFNDKKLLKKSCSAYLSSLGVNKKTIDIAIKNALKSQEEYNKQVETRCLEVIENARKDNRMVIVLAGRPYHIDPLIQHKISQYIADLGIDVITENISTFADESVYKEIHTVPQWAYPNRIIKAANYVANSNDNIHFVELTSFGCGPDAFILDEVKNILKRKGKNSIVLKIDDVNNIGSIQLRIRSLIENIKINNTKSKEQAFITTPRYSKKDKNKTIIAPYFAEGYSEFLPSLFKIMGHKLINLPKGDKDSTEIGLKYANNEVCYPATIVIGNIINELQSKKYKEDEIIVAITQTGGQCRASNYLALIKNAMITAGLEHIPVISIGDDNSITNNQKGFKLNWKNNLMTIMHTMFYADCISKLYYSSAVREKKKGTSELIRNKYIQESFEIIENKQNKKLLILLEKAVKEFKESIYTDKKCPIIGIVGEIYLKYNTFSNRYIYDWLIEQGVEVSVPSIYYFFINEFANKHTYKQNNIKREKMPLFISDAIYRYIHSIGKKYDMVCKDFPNYRPQSDVLEEHKKVSCLINPATNFGEGWLLPSEIIGFIENGINNIISLQPFGCIANHIIAKGIENKVKKVYPNINMLALDFDSGTSEANTFNRIHFMVENCKEKNQIETSL